MNYDECEHGEHRPECAECKHTYVVTDDMRDRDARWMRVVRRLWRQRDEARAGIEERRGEVDHAGSVLSLVRTERDALRAQCVLHANAYEDEHRRATRLQERVSWLENNWGPKP